MHNPGMLAERTPPRGGFTLIEISIVLVIIGLVVGGIILGMDMMCAASVQGVIKEKDEFQVAIWNFRQKYRWLPGDMPTAPTIWGVATTNGAGVVDQIARRAEVIRQVLNRRTSNAAATGSETD